MSGWFSSLRGFFGGDGRDRYTETPFQYPQHVYLGKSAVWQNIGGQEAVLYRTTPELKAVINKKAVLFSNGVYKHYKIGRDGKPELIENSPIVDRLENPNVLQSRNEWMEQRMINQCLYGNDYTYALYGTNSALAVAPSAIWNLIPNRMIINRTGLIWKETDINKIVSSYEFQNDGTTANTIFDPKEIFHNKTPNPEDPLIGISPLESLQMPISNIRLSYGFRNVIMADHGALGFITSDGKDQMGPIPMTPEQKKDIERQYSKDYGIKNGQSRVKIIDAVAKWQATTFPTKDLMLFEEISADRQAIINEYGLNTNVFADEKGATYENAREGKKSAYQDSIIPYAEKDCFGLSWLLGLVLKGEWIELDYYHLECLQENEKEKAETLEKKALALSTALKDGVLSKEKYAEIFGVDLAEVNASEAQAAGLMQAQTELRGTVGGLDGIIAINDAVSTGRMDRETGINTLVNYYGYERSIAQTMVTTLIPSL